uniref:Uncharacterized protein n=1 Tax=Clytia hemisphaerica TaxID=252671 RepID=A0A7M5XCV0_9CNID
NVQVSFILGTLCGQCTPGYHQSYFSTNCIENSKCSTKNQRKFWTVYVFTAFLLTCVILSTKDFAVVLVAFVAQVRNLFKCLKIKLFGNKDENISRINSCISYNNIRIKNKCLIKEEKPRQYIFSAVLQITLSFFQIVSLLSIRNDSDTNKMMTRMVNLFNLQLAVKQAEEFCPFEGIEIIWTNFLKNVLFILLMLLFLVIFSLIHNLICFLFCGKKAGPEYQQNSTDTEKYDDENRNTNERVIKEAITKTYKPSLFQELLQISFTDKLILTFIKILMFGYKNISLFTIVSLNCVKIYGEPVLYISGNIKCYQPWQWSLLALLILWVVPFPVALVLAYRLYQKGIISKIEYITILIFPILAFGLYFYHHGTRSRTLGPCQEGLLGALSDIFEEPYRVTQTATEDCEIEEETLYWWTAWRLYERLLIAVLVTFIIEPLFRMCVIAPVIAFLSILHYQIKPYKETMTLLSLLDISSYVFLTFYVVDNMFRSFAYTFDLPLQNPIDRGLKLLGVFEALLTPLTVICLFVIASIARAVYEIVRN